MVHYARHEEAVIEVPARPEVLFGYLDDQASLGAHMEERSAMMIGARMRYQIDEAQGRAVGSVIRMDGSVLGLKLSIEEVVVTREPPVRKVWETRGRQRMLLIDGYRMGFQVEPCPAGSRLRVFIDYDLPASLGGRLVGRALAPAYARWCVTRMADDARRRFAG